MNEELEEHGLKSLFSNYEVSNRRTRFEMVIVVKYSNIVENHGCKAC